MEQHIISGDGHIDIVWLPEDLFVSEAPSRLKERMPKVIETDEGRMWISGHSNLGLVADPGLTGSYSGPYQEGLSHTLDNMEELGFFSDAVQGIFRPTSPGLRILDQDTDGISGEVIYGILGVASGFSDHDAAIFDPEILVTVYNIYNRWIADFCRQQQDRFVGIACVSCHDPQVAAQQLRDAAKMGLGGAELGVSNASVPIYQRDWDVVWATAVECKIPISFHTVGLPFRQPEPSVRDGYELVVLGLMYSLFQLSGPEILSSIILSGACDRYPDFKFVLGECGVGWIPYLIERLDQKYEDRLFRLGYGMRPTEFWAQNGHTTFQDECLNVDMIQIIGANTILWGSDYPHPEGTWPHSRKIIERNLGHLPHDLRTKIISGNSRDLYGFTE